MCARWIADTARSPSTAFTPPHRMGRTPCDTRSIATWSPRGRASSCGSPECGCSSTWASQSTWAWSVSGTRGEHHGSYAMDIRVETSVDGRAWHEAVPRSPMELSLLERPPGLSVGVGVPVGGEIPARRGPLRQDHPVRAGPALSLGDRRGLRLRGPGRGGRAQTPASRTSSGAFSDLGLGRVYADRWMSAQDRGVLARPGSRRSRPSPLPCRSTTCA